MLQGIGYFITSLADEELPAPQELVGPDDRLLRVADYLDRGLIHESYRGISWCRFQCGEECMGSRDLTDGVWVWPEGLSHYLRRHSVRLPEEFVAHAMLEKSSAYTSADPPVDLQLWSTWSRRFRQAALRDAIAAGRLEAVRLADAARQERIDADTAKHGESESRCIQSGCQRHALRGMVLCAYHLPEMLYNDVFDNRSHELLRHALSATA